jgi:hypothetical protein
VGGFRNAGRSSSSIQRLVRNGTPACSSLWAVIEYLLDGLSSVLSRRSYLWPLLPTFGCTVTVIILIAHWAANRVVVGNDVPPFFYWLIERPWVAIALGLSANPGAGDAYSRKEAKLLARPIRESAAFWSD